jgi:hypothetical protein
MFLRHLPDQSDGFLGYLGLARSGLGLALPIQAKELPMPMQKSVRLNDQESLLPRSNQRGHQDEEDAIGPAERWPFHLSLKDDELLAEEGIFCHQFRFASTKVGQGLQRQGGSERFRPMSKMRVKHTQAILPQPPERGENTSHTRSFSIM